ncbi:hypothetical protein [Baaleninema sp.]|uniref:hypothetical protein n=1 Tax=Baaleninema sp. TaxID=3101197 RepID=UPI003D01AFD9
MRLSLRFGVLAIVLAASTLTGCQTDRNSNPENAAESAATTSQATEKATSSENDVERSQTPDSQTSNSPDAENATPEALYGRWEVHTFITPDGETIDLTDLPPEQRADLSWELTEDGEIRIGDLEGTYRVEGNTIYATNPESGNITEFEFTVSETELSVIKKDEGGGRLQLVRMDS